jgi:hypothetical protein
VHAYAVGIFGNDLRADSQSRLVPKGTMLPLASSASVFGCREMVVGKYVANA